MGNCECKGKRERMMDTNNIEAVVRRLMAPMPAVISKSVVSGTTAAIHKLAATLQGAGTAIGAGPRSCYRPELPPDPNYPESGGCGEHIAEQCEWPLVLNFTAIPVGGEQTQEVSPTNDLVAARATYFGPQSAAQIAEVTVDNSTFVGGSGGAPFAELYNFVNDFRGIVLPVVSNQRPIRVRMRNVGVVPLSCQIVFQGKKRRI